MKIIMIFFVFCSYLQQTIAQSSPLIRSTSGISGSSETIYTGTNTYIIQQSIGQTSAIGTFKSNDYTFRQGFIQPNVMAVIKDKNIPLILKITIYPNPFEKDISLSFNEEIKDEVIITVFDITGRLIFSKRYMENQHINVELGFLPSAAYIIKAIANHKQFIGKIIKI